MTPSDIPDLDDHRAKYSFYYERAEPLEETAMNTICWLNICVTLAVHGNRKYLPPEVLAALEKTTDVVEGQFMEVSAIIREGQAYHSLTEFQREAIDTSCLRIQFLQADDPDRSPS